MKRILLATLLILLLLLLPLPSQAEPSLLLTTNTQQVEVNHTFTLSISSPSIKVASCTLQIFFHPSEVEPILPSTSHYQLYENRILYTWHDTTGGNAPISETPLTNLSFKALQSGPIHFSVHAQLFTLDQTEYRLSNTYTLQSVSTTRESQEEPPTSTNTHASNTSLYTLRISEEGLSPSFDPAIFHYYYLAPPYVEAIQVTALPQNANATVEITGNTSTPFGESTIQILVTSEDASSKQLYTIHVTKTAEPEKANANLETLALENIALAPPFQPSITHYTATAPFSLEKATMLAIPTDENAQVAIPEDTTLSIGDTSFSILVTAANGTTTKEYSITVHRRSEEEQQQSILEQEQLSEALNTLYQEESNILSEPSPNDAVSVQKGKRHLVYIYLPLLLLVSSVFVGITIFYKKHMQP